MAEKWQCRGVRAVFGSPWLRALLVLMSWVIVFPEQLIATMEGEKEALDLYEQAAKAYREWSLEKHQEADSLFRLAYQKARSDSLRAKALYMMARCAKDMWHTAKAESLYWAVVEKFPKSYLADDAFFQVAYLEGDIDSSITLYEQFLRRFPNSEHAPGVCYRLGWLLYSEAKGQYQKGREVLRRLIKNYPDSDEAHYAYYLIGTSYRKEGLIDSAVVWFKQFEQQAPEFAMDGLDEVLGDVFENRRDWKKALELYGEIRGIMMRQKGKDYRLPGFAQEVEDVLVSPLTRIQTLKWQIERSESEFQKFQDLWQMGDIYARSLWDWRRAIEAWKKALELSTSQDDRNRLLRKIADCYLFELNRPDSAVYFYGQWTEAHPEEETIWQGGRPKRVVLWDESIFVDAAEAARRAAVCNYLMDGMVLAKAVGDAETPRKSWPSTLQYEVKAGQNLYSISKTVYGEPMYWRMIFRDNDTTLTHPDTVRAGEKIVLRAVPDIFRRDRTLRLFMLADSAVLKHSPKVALQLYGKALKSLSERFAIKTDQIQSVEQQCRALEKRIGARKGSRISYEFARLANRLALSDPVRIEVLESALATESDSNTVAKLSYTLGKLYLHNGGYAKAARYFERCANTGAAGSLEDDAIFHFVRLRYAARNDHIAAARAFEDGYKRCGVKDFGAYCLWNAAIRYEYGERRTDALRCYKMLYENEDAPLALRLAALYNSGVMNKYVLNRPKVASDLFKKLLEIAEAHQKDLTWESGGKYVWRAREEIEE